VARALGALDVTQDGTREQLESIVGRGEDHDFAQAPFTPRSKKVLELGLREALRLGQNYIGTEHILLGLVKENEGVACRILSNLGVSSDEVRREVALALPGGQPSDMRRLLFRGQVLAFKVRVRFGSLGETAVPQTPQAVSVELDYAYSVQDNGNVLLGTVDASDLREGVATVLEGEEFVLLEAGLVRAGEWALEEFSTIREIPVHLTVPRASDPGRSPSVRLSRTVKR